MPLFTQGFFVAADYLIFMFLLASIKVRWFNHLHAIVVMTALK
jgi:hypothetical protein